MIFWKHIKGLHKSTSSDELWSFIRFQKKAGSSQAESTKFANVPSIHLNTSDDDTASSPSCGHIITEKATDQSITNPFTFLSNLNVNGKATLNNELDVDDLATFHAGILLKDANYEIRFHYGSAEERNLIRFQTSGGINQRVRVGDVNLPVQFPHFVYVNSSWPPASTQQKDGDLTANRLFASEVCQAPYFNATSDRRAKTDIQPLLINALELVKKTQLYSFKYKETDTPSIGIIAQDVQDVNINGFKLVDNEEASGKDLDYMTIHESKLAYILWKAVQEQQKEIEELRKQLNELKKN